MTDTYVYPAETREKIVNIINRLLKKTFSIKWEKEGSSGVSCEVGNHSISIFISFSGRYKILITDGYYKAESDEMPKMLEIIYTRAMYQINKRNNKAYDELNKKLNALQ